MSRFRGALTFVCVLVLGSTAVLPADVASARAAPTIDRPALALAAADEFLDRYLMPSGRISRLDQGGDTVSEGQAYGMLLAVALGDATRFGRLWAWTDKNLQRSDGLFAWRWANGGIADYHPAADADLLIAMALALGAQRFGNPALLTEARRVSTGTVAYETMTLGDNQVLVAGTWAVRWRMINPSYFVTPAMSVLYQAVPEYRWARVAWTSRALLTGAMDTAPHLPSDWAVVDTTGLDSQPVPSPDGRSPRYSYDAARVVVQTAVDCRAAGQQLAASTWPFLRNEVDADRLTMSYSLSGSPIDREPHPLAFVAAAAAAAASGDRARADDLLATAGGRDDRYPTYYGSAWIALGRVWLDTNLLGGCRPGAATRP